MNDFQDFLSPLLLEADPVLLTVNGAQQSFNAQQLINPNKSAMLIDEFRFTGGISDGPSDLFGSAFASVLARLRFGNSNLTNEFIPIPAFAPCYTKYSGDQTRVWHLPKPLYVPSGVQVTAEVGLKLPIQGTARFTVDDEIPWGFAIAGRSVASGAPVPRQVAVPWACATSVYSTQLPYTSKDNELGNPFDSDFYMKQLIGYNAYAADEPEVMPLPFTIQATYGSGKMLVRDPTPFFALFPPDRPIARMHALLKPKDFLKVVLDLPTPAQAALADTFSDLIFTTVGMVGYRMIDTPRGVS